MFVENGNSVVKGKIVILRTNKEEFELRAFEMKRIEMRLNGLRI